MDLEKLVKTSFDQFEPEVNSSVWQRLEQNLNAPATPSDPSGSASVAGKTALKTILGNTSPWVWVAGVISTAAIVTAIITSSPEKKTDAPLVTPTSQENTTVNENVDHSTNENPKFTESQPVVEQKVASNSNDQDNNKSTASTTEELQNESVPPTAQEVTNSTEKAPANLQTASTSKPTEKVKENSTNESPVENNKPAAEFEPAVILSTQVGFAPLKVIALLNKDNIKGNWDFGDGETSIASNTVTHVFKNPGTYKIVCTTGSKTIENTIEVIGIVCTAFSPNGDGKNDEFFIESSQIQIEELSIKFLDRSGRMVFEITQPGQHWDGKDNSGENLPSGTYFYNIFARSANGQINQKGTISIFR